MFKTHASPILFCCLTLFLSPFIQAQTGIFCMSNVMTNEPSLAIHPQNPALQIIGSNVDYYFLSTDTGKTWNKYLLTSTYGVYGDPVVKIAPSGRYYYAHLSKTQDREYPKIFDRIVFQFSDNNGLKFNGGTAIGLNQDKMQDKPWFDVFSPNPSDPNQDIVVITWTEFDVYKSENPKDSARIKFAISKNGGLDFSDAITISQTSGTCLDNSQTPEGATPLILSDGSVHVTWALDEKLYYNSSKDGGTTWNGEKIIENQYGGWAISKSGFMRTNVMPFLVKGIKEELVLVWADNRMGSHHVFVKTSQNKGISWGKTIRVTPKKTEKKGRGDYFQPFPSIDPVSGQLNIVYYFRNQNITQFSEKGVAISHTDYKKFRHHSLTEFPFLNAGEDVFFGDYNAVASTGNYIRSVWTEHSLGKVFLCSRGFFKKPDNPRKPQTDLHADYRKNHDLFVYFYQKRRRNWEGQITVNNNSVHSFNIKRKNKEIELFDFKKANFKIGDSVLIQVRRRNVSHSVKFVIE